MASSFDRSAKTVQAKFYPKSESVDEEFGPDSQSARKTRLRTIFRKDGDQEVPIVDL
jgi:hypothetical protein